MSFPIIEPTKIVNPIDIQSVGWISYGLVAFSKRDIFSDVRIQNLTNNHFFYIVETFST